MKTLVRSMFTNTLALFIVSLLFAGLQINGEYVAYIYAGVLLTLLSAVLDPVVKIVTMPFNILTLGLLSFITTLVALYAVTLIYPTVVITDFIIEETSFLGLSVSRIEVSGLLSFVVISATIYFLNKLINWIFSK